MKLRKTVIVSLTVASAISGLAWTGSLYWHVEYGGRHGIVAVGGSNLILVVGEHEQSYWYTRRPQPFHWRHLFPWSTAPPGLYIPLWIPFVVFGLYPAVAFVRGPYRRRRERVRECRRWSCAKCGYSLRGLDRPRCPECGTQFELHNRGDSGTSD